MKNGYKTFDVVLVNFGKVEFAGEQGGIRPAVIIQNTAGNIYSSTTIVIPTTTKLNISRSQRIHFSKRILQRD